MPPISPESIRRLPRQLREVAPASSIFDTLLQGIEAGPRSTTPTISERPRPLVQPHDGTRSSSRALRPRAAAAATEFSSRACVVSCRGHRIRRKCTQRPHLSRENGQNESTGVPAPFDQHLARHCIRSTVPGTVRITTPNHTVTIRYHHTMCVRTRVRAFV